MDEERRTKHKAQSSLTVTVPALVHFEVIIIGGGAAGLFCAIEAGKRRRKVLVIEHSDRVGKKIGISGGGRCNFTNLHTTPESFLSANPHFCKSALARYTPHDFITLVRKHKIAYHEKKLGQLFCNGSSQQIIDLLLNECSDAGVQIHCGCRVINIEKQNEFLVQTSLGTFSSTALVIATGGLSIKPLGATDFGYRLAEKFGLKIETPRAGLVPMTLEPGLLKQLAPLSGMSVDSIVSHKKTSFRENVLVTHRGLSGPAILQISSFWKGGESISIDLLPQSDAREILRNQESSTIELSSLLSRFLPRRFAHAWCDLKMKSKPFNQYSQRELESIASQLHDFQITPSGTEGFKKAEVTVGGVSTDELSSQTMEARKVPGLYFIGEVVDVTGHLGGFNFQWAWASAFAAGQSV